MLRDKLPNYCRVVMLAAVMGLALAGGTAMAVEYAPGEFLTLEDASIQAGSTYTVTITGPAGYALSMEITALENGKVPVCIPPFAEPSSQEFTTGQVELSWSGGTVSLTISALPELDGVDPVALYVHSLEWELGKHQALLDQLRLGGSSTSLDASIDNLTLLIAREQSQLDEIKASGHLILTGDGPDVVLDAARLTRAARLDYAFLRGQALAMGYESSSAAGMGISQSNAQERWDAYNQFCWEKRIKTAKELALGYLDKSVRSMGYATEIFGDTSSLFLSLARIIGKNFSQFQSTMSEYLDSGRIKSGYAEIMETALSRVENVVGFLGMLGLTTDKIDNGDLAEFVRLMNYTTQHLRDWTKSITTPETSTAIYYYYDNKGAKVGSQDVDAPPIDGSGAWVRVHGGPPVPSFSCLNMQIHQLKVVNLDTGMLCYHANAAYDASDPNHYKAFPQPVTYGDYSIAGLYIGDDWHYPNPSPDMQSGIRYHVTCTDRSDFSTVAAIIGFP